MFLTKLFKSVKLRGFLWTSFYAVYCVSKREQIKKTLISIERKRFLAERTKQEASLTPITEHEFQTALYRYPFFLGSYYRGRWEYFEEVINVACKGSPGSVLEIGPYWLPLFNGSAVMDSNPRLPRLTYCHDIGTTPWPIENSKYDLLIALQVWEHLEDKQQQAFREVMRVSKKAILSFPYMFNCPGDCHHMIDEAKISEWTLGIKPVRTAKIGKESIKIIYVFEF